MGETIEKQDGASGKGGNLQPSLRSVACVTGKGPSL
jgi:hypothetical protein